MILCYFLGNNPPHREFAKRLKEVTGCKIIALTHLDEFVKSDVLHNNGVVFGVELGTDLTARHVAVEKENDLYRFRNSKYVQSSVGGYPPTD